MIEIYYPYSSSFPLAFYAETDFSQTSAVFDDVASFGIRQEFILENSERCQGVWQFS